MVAEERKRYSEYCLYQTTKMRRFKVGTRSEDQQLSEAEVMSSCWFHAAASRNGGVVPSAARFLPRLAVSKQVLTLMVALADRISTLRRITCYAISQPFSLLALLWNPRGMRAKSLGVLNGLWEISLVHYTAGLTLRH